MSDITYLEVIAMCGITGFIIGQNTTLEEPSSHLKKMGDAIFHRGPDAGKTWWNDDLGCGLSHRRLSILDLSEAGAQPMQSHDGRFTIILNGEIYNHLQIRRDLEKLTTINWRGHSDTETLVNAFSFWGIKETINRAVGMFAIAAIDTQMRQFYLIRDRFGEKPLYYQLDERGLIFGSELAALKVHPFFKNTIDEQTVNQFLRTGYIAEPQSIYSFTKKIPPACILQLDLKNFEVTVEKYWNLSAKFTNENISKLSEVQSWEKLTALLKQAVSRQMISDVPIGAFLSGGVDSSLICALMQEQSKQPIKTFTMGFSDSRFDEAPFAKKIASHLGTDHTEVYVSGQDALDIIPQLSRIYSEPFADSSQIPTVMVSRIAKTKVTVSLSGDAGDELFAGYNRHLMAEQYWTKLRSFPLSARKMASKSIQLTSDSGLSGLLPFDFLRKGDANHKLAKIQSILKSSDITDAYFNLIQSPNIFVKDEFSHNSIRENFDIPTHLGSTESMMLMDYLYYLPNDILVKVDRAAMSASLETRAPFLDHELFEFAASLPLNFKIRNGQTKFGLKKTLADYIPVELIDRPKMGFAIPLADWLRGPLHSWASDLISRASSQVTLLDQVKINQEWSLFCDKKKHDPTPLWNLLMLISWFETQKEN